MATGKVSTDHFLTIQIRKPRLSVVDWPKAIEQVAP